MEKYYKNSMKKHILLLIAVCFCCGTVKAQQQELFDEYLREAGDRAEMFIGKIERGYPTTIYVNHPYWLFEDFLTGNVTYNGKLYRNMLMRFDAYQQQLVVKTPVKQSNVCVTMHLVERFTMEGTEYARRNGEFMAILVNTPRMELVEQVNVSLKEEIMETQKVRNEFKRKVKYYVLRDGRMYEVDKMKSVVKLFPEWKKELKHFAKMYNLNFKEHRQSSLMSMVKYADELLAQP